jgi:hypothetical protein
MKILIIVLSYKDNDIYSKFYKAQKDTWDSLIVDGVETYYLFGNHHCDEIIDNELLVNVPEPDYGRKTINSFILTQHMNYDYIFRTNSSSYIDKSLLLEYVKDKPKEKYYSGVIGDAYDVYFAAGAGFFLSKDLVNLVIDNKDDWVHNYIDDVALAKFLFKFGYKPTDHPRFDVLSLDSLPKDFFHYRLKTDNRLNDINNLYEIFKLKNS